jgi:hypothetical protein
MAAFEEAAAAAAAFFFAALTSSHFATSPAITSFLYLS